MRLFLVLVFLWLPLPALAGVSTTLFQDERWRIEGVDPGAEPVPIEVTRKKVALGNFSALDFFFDRGAGFVHFLTLRADGSIEPRLPEAGLPGATAVLGRYFECGGGLTDPLRFLSLDLPKSSKRGNDGYLKLRGTLSNLDSLMGDKLKLYVLAPKDDRVRLEMLYRLRATRDFCVDPARRDTEEEFRIVELQSNYLSPMQHLSDLARYVKAIDVDCNFFGDCSLDRTSQCAPLQNQTGYVIDAPKRLRDREIQLFHTSDLPGETPSLIVEMYAPSPRAVKPQGYVTASADPLERNVALWADWVDVKREHKDGKKVGWFAFALEAEAPRNPGCDRTQEPPAP
jgi:hypothetical protein